MVSILVPASFSSLLKLQLLAEQAFKIKAGQSGLAGG
jgi:hypothetical protein